MMKKLLLFSLTLVSSNVVCQKYKNTNRASNTVDIKDHKDNQAKLHDLAARGCTVERSHNDKKIDEQNRLQQMREKGVTVHTNKK